MKSHASINRIYRLIWSKVRNAWVAVGEVTRGQGKGSSRTLLAATLLASTAMAHAAPTDGVVVSGSGGISQSGAVTTIQQSSQNLSLNWQSFNIASHETVNFQQPNASALAVNRIFDTNGTQILGRLNANGQVYLINPNGILFGQGAQVNVGGIAASTLDFNGASLAGNARSFSGNGRGGIINQGTINAMDGGYVALLGNSVSNQGAIVARLGTVALGAGSAATLTFSGNSLLRMQVDQGILNSVAENGGLIRADGGVVVMNAGARDALLASVVNNTGVIEARTVASHDGVITLGGDLVINTGSLDASGSTGGTIGISGRSLLQGGAIHADGASGGGGSIALTASGALIQTAAGRITANAGGPGGTGGNINLAGGSAAFLSGGVSASGDNGGRITATAPALTLAAAALAADGNAGGQGGTLLIGGDAHGANPYVANASHTLVNAHSTLSAQGQQGKIVVWSDDTTGYFGSATTGAAGFVEVSGKQTLNFGGQIDAGAGGNVLLDPANLIIDASAPAQFYLDLANPNPAANEQHGNQILALTSGNIVVSTPSDTFGGAAAGAVYLYNGTTGALISALTGGTAGDQIGGSGVTQLSSGNFVVRSQNWQSGALTNVGAATWGSGATGVTGVVSSANSLVGGAANDRVGSDFKLLTNGNYLVLSPSWNGARGAVTWGSGTSGVAGVVSSANSLVGNTAMDRIGPSSGDITVLSNGNYLVTSLGWDNGSAVDAGAVTWGSGTAGVSGIASAGNSLVGSTTNDRIGSSGIIELSSGNYLVQSPVWTNTGAASSGALTWGSGTAGVKGVVSSSNSLVGSHASDGIGNNVVILTNGSYVVNSSIWNNGLGAVTWGSGTAGVSGVVSSANSLVGSSANDAVGTGGVTALSNGNYVVSSYLWDNGAIGNAGAVTWGSGTSGVSGVISSANSLIGSTAIDAIGSGGVFALTNGNYVVVSNQWDNGAVVDAGAVTWGSGTTGVKGTVTSSNSLVGSTANDKVGGDVNYFPKVTALSNGNYVVRSTAWNNGSATTAGAITWGNGTTGTTGAVSSSNSLVGATTSDQVGNGDLTQLANGNFVVTSTAWDNGAATNAGAATWINGATGLTGTVSSSNSLVGGTSNDSVGSWGVTALPSGNYLVRSGNWNNTGATNAGAVTWGNGSTGIAGLVSSTNSLVGTHTSDQIGTGTNGVTVLSNGNYLVASQSWDNGSILNAGAITWGSGTAGISGEVSALNSLVGGSASDVVGSVSSGNLITELSNGNFLVRSTFWDNGSNLNAGAITWGSGTSGITGVVSGSNSLVATTANDNLAASTISVLSNGNYLVVSPDWDNGALTNAGAVTWGSGTSGVSGFISAANSLVGSTAQDRVGFASSGSSVTALTNGHYVVRSTEWDNGSASNAGAVTWGSGTAGISGAVTAGNSLVGTTASDVVGSSGVTALPNGNYVVRSHVWRNGSTSFAGAVTWGNGSTGITGAVSTGNSLVGTAVNEQLGSNAVTALGNSNYVVRSSQRNSAAGAVWLVADPSNLAGMINNASGDASVHPSAIAGAAVAGSTVTLQATNNITVNSAINVAGRLNLVAGSALTLNAGITSTATGDALQLAGQTFVNNAGASALSTPSGRWLVWSGTPAGDTRGGLGYDFKQYSATYGVSTALGSGNGFLYTAAPVVTASLTGSISKIYDATTTATLAGSNYAVSGALDGDVVTLNNPAAGTYDTRHAAASGKNVAVTGVAIAGAVNGAATVYGYQLAGSSINGNIGVITPKALSMSGLSVPVSKVYDANTTAVVSGTAALAAAEAAGAGTTSDGRFYSGDTVSITGTATGTYNSKDVATANLVTYGGLSLAGAEAGNYTLSTQAASASTITAASLAVTGVTAASRTYNANTNAILAGTAAVAALGSDVVSVGGAGVGSFANKNVGTGKAVTVTGYALSGTDAGNYTIVQPAGLTADITAASLAVTGVSAASKVYDANTMAALTGTASVAALGSDVVSVGGTGVGSFANKNVGNGKAVTVTGYTLGGTDAGNYVVVQPAGLTADITAASLAVTGVGAVNKVYDANTSAALSGTATVAALGSDVVSVGGAGVGSFANRNVGNGKAVTVTGFALIGTDAGNYVIAQPAGLTADITAATLAVTGVSAMNKVYDTNTTATLTGTANIAALGSDVVNVGGTGVGSFANKNVGNGKAVTVTGFALSGTDAGNYVIAQPAGLTADITAASLAVTGISAVNKVYDTNSTAALSGSATVTALGSDVVSVGGTGVGSFANKNVGNGKAVTVTGYMLGGTDAGNYVVAQPTGLAADITAASLVVTGVTAESKVYDTSTTAALNGTAMVAALGSDVVSVGGTGVGSFANKNVGNGKAVTVTGYMLGGTDAGNYLVAQPGGLTANITAAPLTVTGITAADKIYDGGVAATVNVAGATLNGLLSGDAVAVSATGAFTNKDVGNSKPVMLSSSFSGADASNYSITPQSGTAASITPATLSLAATPANFVVGQTPTGLTGTVNGFVAGETQVGATTGTLAWNTAAGPASQPGQYPIDGSGLTAVNYVFVQAAGNSTALTLQAVAPVPATTPFSTTSVLQPMLGGSNAGAGTSSQGAGNAFGSGNDPAANNASFGQGSGAAPGSGTPGNNTSRGNGVVIDNSLVSGGRVLPMQIVNGGVNMPSDDSN